MAFFQLICIPPQTQRLKRTITYAHGLDGLYWAKVGTLGWSVCCSCGGSAFECKYLLLVRFCIMYLPYSLSQVQLERTFLDRSIRE